MSGFEIKPGPHLVSETDNVGDAWDHVMALGVEDSPQAFNVVYARLGINKLYPRTDTLDPTPRQVEAAERTLAELSEKGLI